MPSNSFAAVTIFIILRRIWYCHARADNIMDKDGPPARAVSRQFFATWRQDAHVDVSAARKLNSVNACYVPATCHVDATSQFHALLFNADEKQMTN